MDDLILIEFDGMKYYISPDDADGVHDFLNSVAEEVSSD